MSITSALIGALATVVVGLIGWLGTLTAAKSKKDEAETTARGPEWSAFFEEVQDWTNKQLKERDDKIASLQSQIVTLRSTMAELENKYRAALRYGRAWRLLHPKSVGEVEVPPEIVDEL